MIYIENKLNIIKISELFIKELLQSENWFKNLVRNKGCDLIVLTGSNKKSDGDRFSDLDLFLVCSFDNQKKFKLKPIYEYNFKGIKVELSMVTREKLFNDRRNKENLYWWVGIIVIKAYNKEVENYLLEASKISKKETADLLWTNFIRYKINTLDMDKLILRKESLSYYIFVLENIKILINTILIDSGKFIQYKWYGFYMKKLNRDLYKKLITMTKSNNIEVLKKSNLDLEHYFIDILKNNHFTEKEIYNWESCNLERIIFQRE